MDACKSWCFCCFPTWVTEWLLHDITFYGRKFTTYTNSFSGMEIDVFWNKFHRRMLLIESLTIRQHWFTQSLGAEQATRHYLNLAITLFTDAHMRDSAFISSWSLSGWCTAKYASTLLRNILHVSCHQRLHLHMQKFEFWRLYCNICVCACMRACALLCSINSDALRWRMALS